MSNGNTNRKIEYPVTMTIRMSDETKETINQLAAADRRKPSELLRILVEEMIAEKKQNADISAAA